MTRHELRESIFKIIFQIPFLEIEDIPEDFLADAIAGKSLTEKAASSISEPAEIFLEKIMLDSSDYMDKELKVSEDDYKYIRRKVTAISTHITEIDEELKKASNGKGKDWYGKSELAILRLAIYEIEYDDDIPAKVAINEAIELAKVYCDEKAAPLINGVLSKLISQ